MDRPRLFRGLRIAVSVVFGILCVLLIVLWVRSYHHIDTVVWGHLPRRCTVADSVSGRIYLGFYTGTTRFRISSVPLENIGIFFDSGTSALIIRHWSLVLIIMSLAIAPGIPCSRRFNLRTVLIATTLVAVLLAMIVAFAR
jgi:hypothetical protein